MKKTLSQKGFSLIELLVVIAIIAILTAIVTSNFTSSKAKSRDAKRVSDIAQIQLAFALFFDRCNSYPAALTLESSSNNCKKPDGTNVTLGDYMSVMPKESTTVSYGFVNSGGTVITDYVLRANLETKSSVLNDDVDGTQGQTSPVNLYNISGGCGNSNDDLITTGGLNRYYYCVKPN